MQTKVGSPKIIQVKKKTEEMLSFNIYQSNGEFGAVSHGWKVDSNGLLSQPLIQFRPGKYFAVMYVSKAAALDILAAATVQFKEKYPAFFPENLDPMEAIRRVVYTPDKIAKALPETRKPDGTDAEI